MRHLLFTLLALASLAASPARADDSDAFLARISDLETLQGRFVQEQQVPGSSETLVSEGRFRLLRPGYFAWEIEHPDRQLVLATPDYLWHHDRDLETVTRRPVDGSAQMTPLQVLGGNAVALRASYAVEQLGEGEFRLTPIDPEAGFRSLVLHFTEQGLGGMSIVDSLGQPVEVRFSELQRNRPLGVDDFQFSPPPDADLFYHEQ